MKSQISSTKSQTNLKFQYSMTKTQNRFGISNFGHCDLFDICYLLFVISIPPVLQNSSPPVPAKVLNSDLALRIRFSMLNRKPPLADQAARGGSYRQGGFDLVLCENLTIHISMGKAESHFRDLGIIRSSCRCTDNRQRLPLCHS